jgi:hypothetical protein
MSLDLYIIHKRTEEEIINEVREAKKNNVRLETVDVEPTVWWENITHNLGKMAKAVPVRGSVSLYDLLWHPREAGFTKVGKEYIDLVAVGYNYLETHPELRRYNPENGWGDYEGLLDFTRNYNFFLQNIKDYDNTEYIINASV